MAVKKSKIGRRLFRKSNNKSLQKGSVVSKISSLRMSHPQKGQAAMGKSSLRMSHPQKGQAAMGKSSLRMSHPQKGQAAMEFLMTYGWAILAGIIALGVLAAFGVFTPGKGSDQIMVTAPFYGKAITASNAPGSAGEVSFELLNGGGEDYTITGVDATGCGSTDQSISIKSGETAVLSIPCDSNPLFAGFSQGQVVTGEMNIRYRKPDSLLELTVRGYYQTIIRKGVSPLLSILFHGTTPANGATLSGDDLTIEFSTYSSGDLDRYAFVDLDNSLVGWWRMDDTPVNVCNGAPASDCSQWNGDQSTCESYNNHGGQCSYDIGADNCAGALTCAAQTSSANACNDIFGCSYDSVINNAADLSTHGNDGSPSPTAEVVNGKFGKAIELEPAGEDINLGALSNHNSLMIENDITISSWVNYNLFDQIFVLRSGDNFNRNILYNFKIGTEYGVPTILFSRGDSNILVEEYVPTPNPFNGWHNIAVTVRSINMADREIKFYADGVEIGSQTYVGEAIQNLAEDAKIGTGGILDEVMLFNRAFSEDEIKSLYDVRTNGYSQTFSGLSSGTHTYKAYIVDSNGELKSTSTRTVNVL